MHSNCCWRRVLGLVAIASTRETSMVRMLLRNVRTSTCTNHSFCPTSESQRRRKKGISQRHEVSMTLSQLELSAMACSRSKPAKPPRFTSKT